MVELYEHETVVVLPDARFTLDGHETVTAEDVETLRLMGPERPARLAKLRAPFPEGAVNVTDDPEMLKSRIVTGRVIE